MTVGICAMIKDCLPKYIIEWVQWHRLIGVDYFFIYDNQSSIPISETLKDYKNIYVFPIEGKLQQYNAFNDCIKKQKEKSAPSLR